MMPPRPRERALAVEGQPRIDFGAHAPGHDAQDLQAEAHQHLVDDLLQRPRAVGLHGLGQQRRVLRLLHRLQDERGVGGRVARGELGELPEVAGVGDDGGVLLELVELVHGRLGGGNRSARAVAGWRGHAPRLES
jgi:hypothetical protein